MQSTRDKLKRAVRKTVKWGGAGLTVLLLVVWVGSGWVLVGRSGTPGHREYLARGSVNVVTYGPPGPSAGVFILGNPITPTRIIPTPRVQWERSAVTNPGFDVWLKRKPALSGTHLIIPLWPAALLSLPPTILAWRADARCMRRARAGHCPECGYDRAGLAAGSLCPECGKQPEAR